MWVVVGSCAGFPGGLAVSWYFLVPRWCLWPLPCMLAGPSLPLLAFPPCPVHVTAYVTFPWLGMSWPHFMWVSSPGLCWVVVSLGGAVPLVIVTEKWGRACNNQHKDLVRPSSHVSCPSINSNPNWQLCLPAQISWGWTLARELDKMQIC